MFSFFSAIFYQITANTNIYQAINNAIVINKNASKINKFCVLQFALFSFQFVGTVSSII